MSAVSEAHAAPTGDWDAALDALEARLARQEAALAGADDDVFEAVELPSVPLGDEQRIRAQLALGRLRALERAVRDALADRARPARSPYR